MPDAKDNTKQTGDTRLPEVESEFESQEGSPNAAGIQRTPSDRGRGSELGDEGRPGRGINQAGFIKDREAPTSDSYGNTRDSGES